MSRVVIVGEQPWSRFLEAVRRLFSGPQCLIPPNTESKCVGEVWRNEDVRRLRGASVAALLRGEPFAQAGANPLGIDAKNLFPQEAEVAQTTSERQWRALLWLTFAAEQQRNCTNVDSISDRIREAYVRGDDVFPRFITLRSLAVPRCLFFDDVVRHWNGATQLSHSIVLDWPVQSDLTLPATFRLAWPLLPTFEAQGAPLTAEQAETLARYTQQIASTSADNVQKLAYEKAAAYLQTCSAVLSTRAQAAAAAQDNPLADALIDASAARRYVERIWGTRFSAEASARAEREERGEGAATVLQRWNARQERETMWTRIRAMVPGQPQALPLLLSASVDSLLRCKTNPIRDGMYAMNYRCSQKQQQQQNEEGIEWQKGDSVVAAAGAEQSWIPELPSSGRCYFDAWIVALMACAQQLGSFRDEQATIHTLYTAIQLFNAVRASGNVASTIDIEQIKQQIWREFQTAAQGQLDPGNGSADSLAILHEQFDAMRPQAIVRRAEWGFATSSRNVGNAQYRQGPQPLPRSPFWLPYSTRYRHRLTALALLLKLTRATDENGDAISTEAATFTQNQTLYFSFVLRNNGPTTFTGQLRAAVVSQSDAREGGAGDQHAFVIESGGGSGGGREDGETSFTIQLDQPLPPGAQIDIPQQIGVKIARAGSVSKETVAESLRTALKATRNTTAYTAWTYASQISLQSDRLAQRLEDGTRAEAALMRQPVDAALLVPFSRTLVDVSTGVQRRLWGAPAISEDDDNPQQRVIVLFNDQRLNFVQFSQKLELAQGLFRLVAAIACSETNSTFTTFFSKGSNWFVVRHSRNNATDTVEPIDEQKASQEFGCNAHRIVQAWYVLSEASSGASMQQQRQQMAALQNLLPVARVQVQAQPTDDIELNTIAARGRLLL